TFNINSPNPNSLSPSSVPAKFYLTSSLAATATVMYTGPNAYNYGPDLINTWMGYWSASGGYTPSPIVVLYQLTSGVGTGNWDDAYLNIKNYSIMETLSLADSTQVYYGAISLIMQAFMYQRIVDLYNNAPYSQALSSSNTTPGYDLGSDIYNSNISHIDSAIGLIKSAGSGAENPGNYDVMFGGDMSMWIIFANTVKLKMLMRLTETASGPAFIKSELALDTLGSFLGPGQNASVNPGYSNASNAQENPLYLDIAFTNTGSPGTNNVYWRANSYAVGFYTANNDPRAYSFYLPNAVGVIQGRKIGSTSGVESNSVISAVNGPGVAGSATQNAVIIGAFESLFLQAEAVLKGYITGDDAALYKSAVEASFELLGTTDNPDSAADAYILQANNLTNYASSPNKLKTLITQKWAACNTIDPLESFSDWRRLGIPTDLPVSDYPGNTATHVPYRFLYPTSEDSYNALEVGKEGTINVFTSKIFWQP
ncbi:MAG TPA: SusD/RagB family nutrient-binding outer membrane lipoprotein, partial [Puia sp.]